MATATRRIRREEVRVAEPGGNWSRCLHCGAPVTPGAAFCRACGRPTVAAPVYATYGPPGPPPPPVYARPQRSSGCLRFTLVVLAGLLALCLAGFIVLIAFDLPTRVYMRASGRDLRVGVPVLEWDTPTQYAAVEQVAEDFETALRARDVEGATALVDPAQRELYRAAFSEHKNELPELAAIVATRKPVVVTDPVAEYQVAEGGRKGSLRFILIDGKWYVSSL